MAVNLRRRWQEEMPLGNWSRWLLSPKAPGLMKRQFYFIQCRSSVTTGSTQMNFRQRQVPRVCPSKPRFYCSIALPPVILLSFSPTSLSYRLPNLLTYNELSFV